jgi:hypothetical protein
MGRWLVALRVCALFAGEVEGEASSRALNPIDFSPQQGVLDRQLLERFVRTLELLAQLGDLRIGLGAARTLLESL